MATLDTGHEPQGDEKRTPSSRPTRWFSRRAVLFHLALIIWFPGCIVACWWQVTVALAGNPLGWLYSVEWPVFAVFGTIGWWQLVHDDELVIRERRARRARARPADPESGRPMTVDAEASIHLAEQQDDELAAYNAYLAGLSAESREKTWRNPTGKART